MEPRGGLDRDRAVPVWSLERERCGCCPDYVLPDHVEAPARLCVMCEGPSVDVLEWELEGGVWPEEEQDEDENEDLPAPLAVGADGWPLDAPFFPTP